MHFLFMSYFFLFGSRSSGVTSGLTYLQLSKSKLKCKIWLGILNTTAYTIVTIQHLAYWCYHQYHHIYTISKFMGKYTEICGLQASVLLQIALLMKQNCSCGIFVHMKLNLLKLSYLLDMLVHMLE